MCSLKNSYFNIWQNTIEVSIEGGTIEVSIEGGHYSVNMELPSCDRAF